MFRTILFPATAAGGRRTAWGFFGGATALIFCLAASLALAAEEAKSPAKAAGASSEKKPNDALPPAEVFLRTADGMDLAATYYPSKKGKEAVPVVLLHQWKHDSTDFKTLARYLQQRDYAVLAPDLRGHGKSAQQKMGNQEWTLDAAKFFSADFGRMVTRDFLAIRDFLWEKNNQKELNINKLCLVGEEMGASVALGAAALDARGYEYGSWRYGTIQQGRFVKALVLISPEFFFKGLSIWPALQDPYVKKQLSIMILVGKEDSKAFGEADRLYRILEKSHPLPPEDKREKEQMLFFYPFDTKLQGANLLEAPNLGVDRKIGLFLYYRIVRNQEARRWSWEERKLPHQ
ncbi:MAG: alpha/beta fold hydrolase [Pirellulales bacterium]|nr:alpha/beta fold hydrolase [Pirellulales bacterium]